jgi:hypothetical protein
MKTFLSDIFPRIQRYSEKLDNLTLLTNQHWVFVDNLMSNKTVYIFRSNNELLISHNGKVEKAKWEFLENQSLLIDQKSESFLFKHGFFDENVLALKIDSKEEYAIFVNENTYDGEINSIDKVSDFLQRKYFNSPIKIPNTIKAYNSDKGEIKIELNPKHVVPKIKNKVFQNNLPAKDGRYKLGFLDYIEVKNGIIIKNTFF